MWVKQSSSFSSHYYYSSVVTLPTMYLLGSLEGFILFFSLLFSSLLFSSFGGCQTVHCGAGSPRFPSCTAPCRTTGHRGIYPEPPTRTYRGSRRTSSTSTVDLSRLAFVCIQQCVVFGMKLVNTVSIASNESPTHVVKLGEATHAHEATHVQHQHLIISQRWWDGSDHGSAIIRLGPKVANIDPCKKG